MDRENYRYRDAPQRRAGILGALQETGFLTISELAERLGVSEMTIRRDARLLDRRGEAIASRGALRLPTTAPSADPESDDDYLHRARSAAAAKEVIGRLAADDVRDDDVIAIDAGTTAFELARALPAGFTGTVVTHSIPVIDLLAGRPQIKTIALGGDVHPPSRALVGSWTVDSANRLRVRTFYLGAAAVDERGIYAAADVERQVKTTLMGIADRVVLLLDRRKFEATAPVLLCDWDEIDLLICDERPPAAITPLLGCPWLCP
jgi:DeoR/GlpR family transcriptional regulator of sugar metabolism